MVKLQNLHAHSTYCDGTLTLEEMVLAAISKGCGSFGFSGHSYAVFDEKCCMSLENTSRYMREIGLLKEKYADRIELFCGIEQEYYADEITQGVDYIIGAVHFTKKGDAFVCIDGGAEGQKQECDKYYGGDYYAMAEDYFETMADVAVRTNADIIAHFDLVTKYNSGEKLFSESHPRYVDAAISSIREILKTHKLFEVNTSVMYRFGKPEPYPAVFLLKELLAHGGEVILSSDSHNAESICKKFDDAKELLKSCGFKYTKQLTADGFVDVKL